MKSTCNGDVVSWGSGELRAFWPRAFWSAAVSRNSETSQDKHALDSPNPQITTSPDSRSPLRFFRRGSPGFTFVELVVATAVMMILASAALPIARVSIKRQREKDLRYTLREMRTAIDKFKDYADTQRIAQYELQFGSENYPASLEQLVDGGWCQPHEWRIDSGRGFL